jgi:hypothetical protein
MGAISPQLSQQSKMAEQSLKRLQMSQEADNTIQQTTQQEVQKDIKLVFGPAGGGGG